MANVLVWSERPEPNAPALKDCTYSTGLMGMVYSGFTAFPKGIYTVEEREALERSDDQPNETGASTADIVVAIKRRYGKTILRHPPEELAHLLDKPNVAFGVQGRLSNFPAGHRLRRHQPGFTGGHMLLIVNEGGGKYRWLDPLAPNKSVGDLVTKTEVMKYAQGLGMFVTFNKDSFAPAPVVTPPPAPVTYTQAQMDSKQAQVDAAQAALRKALADLGATEVKVKNLEDKLARIKGFVAQAHAVT